MKLYFDTNILLDHFLGRDEEGASTQIIDWVVKGKVKGVINAISLSNTYYILNQINKKKLVENDIQFLIDCFIIEPCSSDIFQKAIGFKFKDFEDAIQYASAVASKSDFIVTRNKQDFKGADIPLLSSKEAVELILAG
jgi:predicted nucleic acid-binding protein